jgi:hypothetical protein
VGRRSRGDGAIERMGEDGEVGGGGWGAEGSTHSHERDVGKFCFHKARSIAEKKAVRSENERGSGREHAQRGQ